MRKTNQKGFTIIELLVVIVIIGILVALALPQLFAAQARGRDTDRKNDLKNLQQKLETYFNDNDQYPEEVDADGFDDAKITADDMKGPRNTTYVYEGDNCTTGEGCQSYILRTTLENTDDSAAIDDDGTYEIKSVNQVEEEEATP